MKTIYGLTKAGKIKVAQFRTEGAMKIVQTGQYGGKLITNETPCTEKNPGRSNYVSPEEQAVLDVDRDIKKKIEQEFYMEIPSEIEGDIEQMLAFLQGGIDKSVSPMLAEHYDDNKDKVDFVAGMLESAKLDGNRSTIAAINNTVTIRSRKGKLITTMPHIEKEILWIHQKSGRNFVLDGELYNHSDDEDLFDALQSAIKKYNAGVSDLVEFHVYDILLDTPTTALERYNTYTQFLTTYATPHVIPEKQYMVHSEKEMFDLYNEFTLNGYEGGMLRNPFAFYENNRTKNLLKVKEMKDDEFRIIDVIPMVARPDHARIVLLTADGQEFRATPKCTSEEKARILLNKDQYIGQLGTVQFFSKTSKGKPRFPVFKGLRDLSDLS